MGRAVKILAARFTRERRGNRLCEISSFGRGGLNIPLCIVVMTRCVAGFFISAR